MVNLCLLLQANPKDVIADIASFVVSDEVLGRIEAEELEAIARLTSFEAMKNDPRSNYEHWDMFGLRNIQEAPFMRAGTVGDHKRHINAKLEEEIDDWINECQKRMDFPVNFKFQLNAKD